MYKYRRVIISVIALLLAAAILTGLLVTVFAANSADIRTEISGLESKQDELDQKKQELEAQIAANNTQTLNVVEQKAQIDQEIELTRQEVENLNEQIRQYNLLIAEKQAELDQLQTDQNDLLDRYKQRIRAMQEQGDVSYWSIIFGAKTFSEMLNRVSMVEEIAQSDQRYLENQLRGANCQYCSGRGTPLPYNGWCSRYIAANEKAAGDPPGRCGCRSAAHTKQNASICWASPPRTACEAE